jgi:hypothetical protein
LSPRLASTATPSASVRMFHLLKSVVGQKRTVWSVSEVRADDGGTLGGLNNINIIL